ncbi:MAG: LLM class flavin-dependent oxidoreductase [Chloroflexia bacterium]|nr:LLM class flavin-dependent oxidoreductase [Chloroflexia bacterium]
MRYGFIVPVADIRQIITLAQEAEAAGWDGFFYWDGINVGSWPVYDPWVTLGAVAMATARMRLGAIISPLSRRRPWKVARETITVDHLSNGRLVVPVGLGTLDDGGFTKVSGEPTDRRIRAARLDESLEILTGLWTGEPFAYRGEQFQMEEMTFLPTPIQRPRIPIWVVGAWPSEKSMRRAARYDGLLPAVVGGTPESPSLTPDILREMVDWLGQHREQAGTYDIVVEGRTPGDNPSKTAEIIGPWAEAGATWWLEAMWEAPNDWDDLLGRVRQGPTKDSGLRT